MTVFRDPGAVADRTNFTECISPCADCPHTEVYGNPKEDVVQPPVRKSVRFVELLVQQQLVVNAFYAGFFFLVAFCP